MIVKDLGYSVVAIAKRQEVKQVDRVMKMLRSVVYTTHIAKPSREAANKISSQIPF